MATTRNFLLAGFVCLSAGCTFFEQPLDDLRDLAPSAPATEGVNPAPQSVPSPPPPPPTPTQNSTPAASTATAAGASYLAVTPIENLPESATNIAVVHFTRKDTDRAVALCKVLIDSLQLTDIQELPAQATNVVIWPVANDNAGGNCIEMLTDYEPIDVSVEAAKKVNESAEGPFLLTQHMSTGNRLIYDMSFVSSNALKPAVGSWKGLMGSDPANWPTYRRAR